MNATIPTKKHRTANRYSFYLDDDVMAKVSELRDEKGRYLERSRSWIVNDILKDALGLRGHDGKKEV